MCIEQPYTWMCLIRALPANWVVRCWFVCELFIVAVRMWVGNDDDDDNRSIASKPNMRNKNDKPLLMAAAATTENRIERRSHAMRTHTSASHRFIVEWIRDRWPCMCVWTRRARVYWLKVKAAWRRAQSSSLAMIIDCDLVQSKDHT